MGRGVKKVRRSDRMKEERILKCKGALSNLTLLIPQVAGSLLPFDVEFLHFRGIFRRHLSVISPLYWLFSHGQWPCLTNMWFKTAQPHL